MRYWIDFRKLREELSFEKLLEQYAVKLHRKGEQATGPCPLPLHTGERKTDSFSANLPKGIFQCFSCGAKGNLLDFAVLMEKRNPKSGQDLRQTAIELSKRYQLQHVGSEQKTRQTVKASNGAGKPQGTTPSEKPAPTENEKDPIINAPLPFELRDLDEKHPYLHDRGLTPETIRLFGLGFCKKGRLAGRIAIPIHDEGRHLIAYAGRLVDESAISPEIPKYLFPGTREDRGERFEFRKSLVVYNAHRLKPKTIHLVVVEGFASVWWLTQNGFPDCVGLMGSSLSPEQAKIIHNIVGDHGHITVLTDGDVPGMRCCDEIRAKLGRSISIHRPKLPIGAQPTDFTGDELRSLIPKLGDPAERIATNTNWSKEDQICSLIAQFPCLARLRIQAADWDAEDFEVRSLKFSSGEIAAAQFVLAVWNPTTKWKCGRFDLVEAASRFDEAHRQVICKWLQKPWWP
jgi:DNA primase